MALGDVTEAALQALAEETRETIAGLVAAEDHDAAVRRFAAILRTSTQKIDRQKIRDRARLVAVQGARCALCLVPFARSPAATRGKVTDRLLCSPCSRDSRFPPPPR